MIRLRDCVDPETLQAIGPKARRLAIALQLGLPVPDGFAILPHSQPSDEELSMALAELSEDLPAEALLSSLTTPTEVRFAVRSSAMYEDLAGASAAGLFLTRTGVLPDGVRDAMADVRASGDRPLVRAYCGQPVLVVVLLQRMLLAERLGVLFLDPDGRAVCEERPADAPEWASAPAGTLSPGDESPLAIGARQLADLLAHEQGATQRPPCCVEYARFADGTVAFLQVRPALFHASQPVAAVEQWSLPTAEPDDLSFLHDVDHNPDPLSAAQAALVDNVADLTPALRQRVLHGYLYYAELPAAATSLPSVDRLAERYASYVVPACHALLSPLEAHLLAPDGALSQAVASEPDACGLRLSDALSAYRGVYQLYVSELSPALRRARQHLDQLLRSHLFEPLSQHTELLLGTASAPLARVQHLWEIGRLLPAQQPARLRAYLARYGAFAACWDVASPCDDERPSELLAEASALSHEPPPRQRLADSSARHHAAVERILGRLPRTAHPSFKRLLPLVRAAQEIAEDDDALFFRAQRLVRWSLLAIGASLARKGRLASAADVFELPLPVLRPVFLAAQAGQPSAACVASLWSEPSLASLATEGRSLRQRQHSLVPPARILRGQPLWMPPRTAILRGYGVPAQRGIVRGRARVVRDLSAPFLSKAPPQRLSDPPSHARAASTHSPVPSPALDDDIILVVPALLPSWAAVLWQARALVADSGGAFSHGAILARERGLPAVVGTRLATRTISDDQEIWVDAERGHVYLIPLPPSAP